MNEKEKTTVPIPSVGADGEQSLSYVTNEIITAETEEINPIDENMEEMLRQMQRMSDPSYLATMTMSQLYDTVYESRLPIIDGLLYPGTYLFVGAPKVGKSFLMAQIAYHVSTGQALWNYPVHAGTVLYLALEDDYRRLQERLSRMFGVEGTDTLHFATCAKQLGAGLYEQLNRFVSEHKDTRLIIIDTLQKIRESGGDKFSYANDYEIIGQLKHFADQTGIALLLVHHTRKQQADDKFDRISGTNGLLGAADGAFILEKEKRTGDTAVFGSVWSRSAGAKAHSEKEYGAFDMGTGTSRNRTMESTTRSYSGKGCGYGVRGTSRVEWKSDGFGGSITVGYEAQSVDKASECEQGKVIQ